MLCMKCVAGSVRVLLLQRVFDWVVSPLGIVPCNAWSVDCRVRSEERKVSMACSISWVIVFCVYLVMHSFKVHAFGLWFPTSLYGVLVFGCALPPPPAARRPPPARRHCSHTAHTLLTHTLPTHNLLTHTHTPCTQLAHTHTQLVHIQLVRTQLAHTHTHTPCTQLAHTHTHNLSTYNLTTHNLTPYSRTTWPHTTRLQTQLVTTQLTHTQLAHTQLVTTQLVHTKLAHTQLAHTQLVTIAHTQLVHTQLHHTQLVHTAGVALGDIDRHFAWQAWRFAASTVTLRGRRGTYGTGQGLVGRRRCLGGRREAWRHRPSLCVAGVALSGIDRHFAWQERRFWHWAGSSGALGSRLAPWAPSLFGWQAWDLATSTVTLCGRRTSRHRSSLCVAGVHLWHWAGSSGALGSRLAPWAPLFAWQASGLTTSIITLRGRRGTSRHGSSL